MAGITIPEPIFDASGRFKGCRIKSDELVNECSACHRYPELPVFVGMVAYSPRDPAEVSSAVCPVHNVEPWQEQEAEGEPNQLQR